MLIYSDSELLDLEWLPKLNLDYVITHSIKEYITNVDSIKIAFTTHRFWAQHDTDYASAEDKINDLSPHSLLVFVLESELHEFHWTIWEQCHQNNVYWLLPGYVNDRDDINDNIICWGDWFKTTANIYKQLPNKLAEVNPYAVKPKYFDALLGSPKPHRDFVYESINHLGLADKCIMTYGGDWKENEFYAKDYFIYEPGTELIGTTIGTADWANYHGICCHLSQIIPIKVFNDTAYSIVAETDYDNTLSCFTEKTAKPILARRLFVVFSGYKFLHNLRKLGFLTFDNVIDESYDLIFDDNERYAAAMQQVQWLCQQDQTEIYNKVRDIVEHNYRLIMTRDWTTWSADQVRDIVLKTVSAHA